MWCIHFSPAGWSFFGDSGDCPVETCMQEYNMYRSFFPQLNNSFVCGIIVRAMDCLDNLGCSSFSLQIQRALLDDEYNASMCDSVPTPTPILYPTLDVTLPTPDPTPDITPDLTTPSMPPLDCSMAALPCDSPLGDCCPGIPSLPGSCNPIIDLGTGSTQPEAVHEECNKIPISGEMQHCSMFTYSHIRPFGAYGDSIQTCALPGSWYLIKHTNFSIEVESESESVDSPHTKLTKVGEFLF